MFRRFAPHSKQGHIRAFSGKPENHSLRVCLFGPRNAFGIAREHIAYLFGSLYKLENWTESARKIMSFGRDGLRGCLALGMVVMVVGCGGNEGQVVVEGAWVRENISPQKMTGGYLVLKNGGAATALVSASTDVAEVTELHVMTAQENVMRMRRVDRIPIPEGGVTMLQPGGNHLMLIGLRRDLKSGENVDLTLEFEQGQTVVVQAEVKKVGSK